MDQVRLRIRLGGQGRLGGLGPVVEGIGGSARDIDRGSAGPPKEAGGGSIAAREEGSINVALFDNASTDGGLKTHVGPPAPAFAAKIRTPDDE